MDHYRGITADGASPNFISAVSAAVTVTALPVASLADVPLARIEPAYSGAIRMWEYEGGFPVVFAATTQEAMRLAIAEGYDIDANSKWRLVPPNEPFTMLWDDAVPDGFEPDYKCECDQSTLNEYGCECEASTPSLTLSAAIWAENRTAREGDVIGEYRG